LVDIEILQTGGPEWHSQYGRMMRWFKRLKNISRRRKKVSSILGEDYIYAFFKECWHLKDWLADEVDMNIRQDLKEALGSSEAMIICDCLANGMKHKNIQINNKRKTIKSLRVEHRFDIVADASSKSKSSGQYIWSVVVNDKKISATELATDCIDFWQAFLTRHKLL